MPLKGILPEIDLPELDHILDIQKQVTRGEGVPRRVRIPTRFCHAQGLPKLFEQIIPNAHSRDFFQHATRDVGRKIPVTKMLARLEIGRAHV